MGSSGSGAADGGIGPIVWVRRRNGSWWPGKIMEPDELAECNLTSPRTGTPVKLLGREDASVDWYNLEKSKRVKAFRCGEFDDCIERAESAQGMPIKKREKYARREDAILHALELEKQLLRKQGKLDVASDRQRSKSSGSAKKELDTSSDGLGNSSGKPGNAKLDQSSWRVGMDVKDEIPGSLMIPVKAHDGNQPTWEEEHCEATPRMRGLQDFGLRTAPLKRKLLSSVDLDGSVKPMADNHSQDPPSGAPAMERTTQANGVEQMGAISRAKRSRCVYLPAESSDSMDDKEVPPGQIKMLPTQFEDSDFHHHPGSLNEENSSSGFMEDVELDSSESNSSESESDSSETEPDMDKEMTAFPDAAVPPEAEQGTLGLPGTLDLGSTSSEESDGSAFSGDMCHLYPDDPFLANEAVSKWQLKRKRNTRHLTKRSVGSRDYGKDYNRLPHGTYHRMKGRTLDQRAYGVDDTNLDRQYMRTKLVGLDNGGYSYMSKFASKGRNNSSCNMTDWDDMAWDDRPVYRGRWEDRGEHFNPIFVGRHYFGGRARSMLVDVDLKVQASYQKERVPIVSLMSKLNGQAIIGHPIQVKALQDGSSKALIPTNDYNSNEVVDHDGNTALQLAWRTARRTNLRVPRPHLTSVLGGDDAAEDVLYIDQERRLPFKKSGVGGFTNKTSLVRKSFSPSPQPAIDRRFPRKLPKKVSLPSYQKTRTLSSIAVQQNFGTKSIRDISKSQMDGLKPETSGPTTVACIPVKLVFSRLLEKINRPPSKPVTKVVASDRDEDR